MERDFKQLNPRLLLGGAKTADGEKKLLLGFRKDECHLSRTKRTLERRSQKTVGRISVNQAGDRYGRC
jgi:hypothetical protein